MNNLDHRRVLLDLAFQLDRNEPLSPEQIRFLSIVFYRISSGEDANKVLQVKPRPGQKLKDVTARRRLSVILHWIACAVNPDPESQEKATSVEAACELAMQTIVPAAKKMYPGADDHNYEAEYLQRCWHAPEYAHLQSCERGWFDPDYPYYFLPGDKDPSSP